MNAIVVYDSQFGNTAQIAEAIGEGFRGAEPPPDSVDVRHVGGVDPEQLTDWDLLVVGSPTQRLSLTQSMRAFLDRIPRNTLTGMQVAAFDTRFTEEKLKELSTFLGWMAKIFGYAADPIAQRLIRKGGEQVLPPEGFIVEDTEGPLLKGELERAKVWAERLLE